MKLFKVLSCVLYSVMENNCCIDYLCCQYKTIIIISSDKFLENNSYNKFFGIDIPYLLMNLISCHGFMKNTNSTVILVCRSWLVNYYIKRGFVIIEHNSKHLISVPNEVKQCINEINIQKQTLLWNATQ